MRPSTPFRSLLHLCFRSCHLSGRPAVPLLLVPLLVPLLPGLPHAVAAQDLTSEEERIVAWVDAHVDDAVDLLERTVNINSGTMNFEGVRRVGDVYREELDALGFETRWIDMSETDRAGHLFATLRGGDGPSILLIVQRDPPAGGGARRTPHHRSERAPGTGISLYFR